MKQRSLPCLLALLMAAFLLPGCGIRPRQPRPIRQEIREPVTENADHRDERQQPRPAREIVRDLVTGYAGNDTQLRQENEALIRELRAADPDAAKRWESILALCSSAETDRTICYDVLPDGLDDTDRLCIVVLGYQLTPDGSMRQELIERLTVAKRSAEKYPNAWIVCTGGPTADRESDATEAGSMAQWLEENGIDPQRLLVEDQSLSTAQNAVFTFDLLEENCPQVRELAIISSDYHIATGTLLFDAEAILRAENAGEAEIKVVSHAAWRTPSEGNMPSVRRISPFRAGALLELADFHQE